MGTDQFSSTLDLLVGYNVNLYVGEEVFKGKLIGVESDHVILENENNYVFYYSIDQVQAIEKNTKQFQSEEITAEFLKTPSMKEVLSSLQNSWVSILCLNKRQFNGILSHVDKDFATLISGDKRILIKLTNISNILKGFIKDEEKTESNEANDQKEAKNENKQVELTPKISTDAAKDYHVSSTSKSSLDPIISENMVKVVPEEKVQPTRVWSEPIKNTSENQNEGSLHKASGEPRKQKEDIVPSSKKTEKQKDKASAENKDSRQKEEKQVSQRSIKESKEVQESHRQEPLTPVYKSKDLVQAQKHSKNEKKTDTAQNKKDGPKHKEQPIRAIRFAGEPVPGREIKDKPSIFSGWPNRTSRVRF